MQVELIGSTYGMPPVEHVGDKCEPYHREMNKEFENERAIKAFFSTFPLTKKTEVEKGGFAIEGLHYMIKKEV